VVPPFSFDLLYNNSRNKNNKKTMIVKAKLNSEEFNYIEKNIEDESLRPPKKRKKKRNSRFGYKTAGGKYVPSEGQYLFCLHHPIIFKTDVDKYARDEVICGFLRQKEVNHDYIHIVNVKRRKLYNFSI
jgi:hypothetical protein